MHEEGNITCRSTVEKLHICGSFISVDLLLNSRRFNVLLVPHYYILPSLSFFSFFSILD